MKTCARCKEAKPLIEFPKTKRTKDGVASYCKPCANMFSLEYRNNNLEAARERERKRTARWLSNPDNLKKKYEYNYEYRRRNKEIVNYHSAKRHTDKNNRMPKWLTKEDILEMHNMYKLAAFLKKTTGLSWHVDHIIPLRGKKVSGLHVPNNLQVLPAEENVKKNNKYEVD